MRFCECDYYLISRSQLICHQISIIRTRIIIWTGHVIVVKDFVDKVKGFRPFQFNPVGMGVKLLDAMQISSHQFSMHFFQNYIVLVQSLVERTLPGGRIFALARDRVDTIVSLTDLTSGILECFVVKMKVRIVFQTGQVVHFH